MPELICGSCGQATPASFRFCGHCGASLASPSTAPTAPPAPANAASPPRDERRQVTVLFADVSGFTAMSEQLDAEDVHAVMNEVFAGLGQAVRDEGGHIDKYIGDNLMALFGAPVAHADDPIRACRAALNMQAFLRRYEQQAARPCLALRMRIGINDGLVVAGGVGSDVKRQYSVMGDSVNVASRLETAAEPGTILVSAAVQRRAADRFRFGPSRELTLKGKRETITACVLIEERPAGESAEPTTPFIGRRREIDQLTAALGSVDVPMLIELRGETGVGKARLCHEACAAASVRLVNVTLTGGASRRPFGGLRRAIQAMLIEHTGAVAVVQMIEACTQALHQLDPALTVYREALWYVIAPAFAPADPPDPDPLTLRRTIERGFEQLLTAFAAHYRPAGLFIREYHLADEASLQWLKAAAANPAMRPLPLIISCSDDQVPPLDGAVVMTLDPLPPNDAAELLASHPAAAAIPLPVRAELLGRAGGVPLFIDELVRALLDAAIVTFDADSAARWHGRDDAADELPGSLRSAVVSRIDRLPPPSRDLLHQCSAQGVEFDLDVAECVREHPDWSGPPVAPLIHSFEQQRIVTRSAAPQSPRLRAFRQALARQVCYETMLKRDRRTLHALTADALRSLAADPDRVSGELLAYHEERAERWQAAAEANLRAGETAAGLYLNDDALRRFDHAIELAGRAADDPMAGRRVMALAHRGVARVHLLTGDYAAAADRARRMAEFAATPTERAEARRLLAETHARTGGNTEAMQLLKDVVGELAAGTCWELDVLSTAWADLAQLHHRAGQLDEALACVARSRECICANPRMSGMQADLLEGTILHTAGRFEAAQKLYEHALSCAAASGSLSHQARAANCVGNCARDRGDYEAARASYQRALEAWQRMNNAECIAGAHSNLGNVAMSLGEFDEATRHQRTALAAWSSIGNVRGSGLGHANLAILALEQGDGAAAVAEADTALEQLTSGGEQLLRHLVEVVRIEGLLTCGRGEEAERRLHELLSDATFTAQPLALAGARRALGQAALQRGDAAAAEAPLTEALASFTLLKRTQEAARTRLLLAGAFKQMGRREEAANQADQAAREFESIHASRDLAEARRWCAPLKSQS